MAILKIARMGHPVLGRPAEPVEDPTAPEVAKLVNDMVETMVDANGTGLAAPQVHISKRIVVFYVSEHRAGDDEADGPVPLTVLINPEIEVLDERTEEDWEGCLSLPGLTGAVERPYRIRYRGVTPDGKVAGAGGRRFPCPCRTARMRSSGRHPLSAADEGPVQVRVRRGHHSRPCHRHGRGPTSRRGRRGRRGRVVRPGCGIEA